MQAGTVYSDTGTADDKYKRKAIVSLCREKVKVWKLNFQWNPSAQISFLSSEWRRGWSLATVALNEIQPKATGKRFQDEFPKCVAANSRCGLKKIVV